MFKKLFLAGLAQIQGVVLMESYPPQLCIAGTLP